MVCCLNDKMDHHIFQNHTDGTQASDIIDRHEDIQDELKVTDNLSAEASNNKAEVTDNLSAQASNENEDKGVVDDLLVEASNTDNDQEQTMDVTEEETDLTRTASEDIMVYF